MSDFSELKGRHIVSVDGLEPNSEEVTFNCSDGSQWRMYHRQDCCETVSVVDVVGDAADLADADVLDAREECSEERQDWHKEEYSQSDSFTWTFYIIQTNRGAVTIRWLGESNGYYSESVEFDRVGGEAAA